MSIPGLWIMRGGAMVFQDQRLSASSTGDLMELRDHVRTRHWTEARGWWYGRDVPIDESTNDHVKRHWFNLTEQGWWPQCPVEALYAEGIYQITTRMLFDADGARRDEPFRAVRSYWLTPGVNHFHIALCQSGDQLTVVYLTPPAPGSDSREAYHAAQEPKPGALGYAGQTDRTGSKLWIERDLRRGESIERNELERSFFPGRRVKLMAGGVVPNYRTVLTLDARAGSVTLDRAAYADQAVTAWALGTAKGGNPTPLPGFDHQSDVWVVSTWDQVNSADSEPVDDTTGRPGIVVRRNRSSHRPNESGDRA